MEPMPFRRNAGLERLEWSGCKAGESGVVRFPSSADTWREEGPDAVFGTDEQQASALRGLARSAFPNIFPRSGHIPIA